MKKILLFIVLSTIHIGTLYGQKQENYISIGELNAIKFNGVSFGAIYETYGDCDKLEALFKNKKMEEFRCLDNEDDKGKLKRSVLIDALRITFKENKPMFGEFTLTNIYIEDKSIAVSIKGKTVHVGDPWQALGNVKLLTRYNEFYGIWISDKENDSERTFIFYLPVNRATGRIKVMYYKDLSFNDVDDESYR